MNGRKKDLDKKNNFGGAIPRWIVQTNLILSVDFVEMEPCQGMEGL